MFSEPTAARILPRLWLTCTVTPEQSGTIPGTGGNRQMVYRQFIYLSGGFSVDHCAEPAIIQHERSIARSKGRTLISSLQGSNESFLLTQSADVLLYSMRSRHCRKRAEIWSHRCRSVMSVIWAPWWITRSLRSRNCHSHVKITVQQQSRSRNCHSPHAIFTNLARSPHAIFTNLDPSLTQDS